MPESVTDRCTKAHEYIFLLTKNKKYYFDQKAIAVPYADKTYTTFGTGGGDGFGDGSGLVKSENWNSSIKERKPKIWKSPAGWDTSSGNGGHGAFHRGGREQNKKEWNPEHGGSGSGFKGHSGNYDTEGNLIGTGKANRRDVWHHEDHQSLLHWLGHNHPDQLRQFLAESGHMTDIWEVATKPFKEAHFATFPMDLIEPCILAGCPIDGIVLEPFAGSNTTGITSLKLQRNYLACELKPEYINIADRRDLAENGLFSANHTQSINQPTT
jgi:site-specific DNA-methyltransferase (adenine-specific)